MKEKFINYELIENFMKENSLSKTAFCKMCKISPVTFAKIMGDEQGLTVLPVFKVAKAMGIHIKDIFYNRKTKR
ncbi:MAG: hypothetical protein J6A28_00980 [Clostridia bacterium]|nr:hypothetical protein [Clostridia bacterium]